MKLSGGVFIKSKKDKDGGVDIDIDPDINDASNTEDEVTDTTDWESIRAALNRTVTKKYKMKLKNDVVLVVPYTVCGDEEVSEALKGIRMPKENEGTKVTQKKLDRNKLIKIKRMNAGLLDGWKIVDKEPDKVGFKEIPYGLMTMQNVSGLVDAIFPGLIKDTSDSDDDDDADGDYIGDGVSVPGYS